MDTSHLLSGWLKEVALPNMKDIGRRDGRCASSVSPNNSPNAIPPATSSPSMGWPMSVYGTCARNAPYR